MGHLFAELAPLPSPEARMNMLVQHTAVASDATTPTKPKPPCTTNPDGWDLDIGTPEIWKQAVRTCQHCPILAQCREQATTLTTRGMPPRSMIWAGVGYDGHGNPVDDVDHYRSRPIEHKRPLRIVRTGPTHARPTTEQRPDHDARSSKARRMIILRRRLLAPTGTSNRW